MEETAHLIGSGSKKKKERRDSRVPLFLLRAHLQSTKNPNRSQFLKVNVMSQNAMLTLTHGTLGDIPDLNCSRSVLDMM
jgi:hypothetical protein